MTYVNIGSIIFVDGKDSNIAWFALSAGTGEVAEEDVTVRISDKFTLERSIVEIIACIAFVTSEVDVYS